MKIKRYIGAVVLTAVVIGFASCSKKQEGPKDIVDVDLQIKSLSLSSIGAPSLGKLYFEVDNRIGSDEGGYISNKEKLGYGIRLGKVKLSLSMMPSVVKVEYAIGQSGTFHTYKEADSIALDGQHLLKLKLYGADAAIAPRSYTVDISQYSHDPNLMEWSSLPTTLPQALRSGSYSALERSGYLDLYITSSVGVKLYRISGERTLSEIPVNGLPSGDALLQVAYGEHRAYALLASGRLYVQEASDATWQQVPAVQAKALLGVLVDASQEAVPALIVEQGDKMLFATYSGARLNYGLEVPEGFPYRESVVLETSRAWVGSSLQLIGGKGVDGTFLETSWMSSNGKDWMLSRSATLPTPAIGGEAVVEVGDRFLRFSPTQEGLKVYVSKDRTQSWVEQPTALGEGASSIAALRPEAVAALALPQGKVLLLMGQPSGTSFFVGQFKAQ